MEEKQKQKLTKRFIDSLVYQGPEPKRHVVWDTELSGFGIRVYPSGKKAFVLSYRFENRKRLVTIGSFGAYTVDQARSKAQKHVVNLDEGVDPLDRRQMANRAMTIKSLCQKYIDEYAKPSKKSWKDDERYINKYFLPRWGNLSARSITTDDIRALQREIGKNHKYAANRILEILAVIYDFAKSCGITNRDFENPARGIKHFPETKRDRWIKPNELPFIFESLNEEENIYARHAFSLYLLTGFRKKELLTAKWEFIDWHHKVIRIPETKNGKAHTLTLSSAALDILDAIPRAENCPYIFPGNKEGQHLVNIDKAWRRVRDRATVKIFASHPEKHISQLVSDLKIKLERTPNLKEVLKTADFELPIAVRDVRIHDLRRTVGSMLAQAGNTMHLIGRVLNHSDFKSTQIYARLSEDYERQALEDHGKHLLSIVGKLPPTESTGTVG